MYCRRQDIERFRALTMQSCTPPAHRLLLVVLAVAVCAPVYLCHAAAAPASSSEQINDDDDDGNAIDKPQQIHWGYDGTYGPSNWASINENCGKQSQSPIDIVQKDAVLDDHLDPIYLTTLGSQDSATASNNGHSVNLALSKTIRVTGGKLSSSYRVAGVHFHWGKNEYAGSEHTVNGKSYPLEMHVVSYDEEHYESIQEAMTEPMGLAVIGLLFEISPNDNPRLQSLVDNLRNVVQTGNSTTVDSFNVQQLLPVRLTDYYRYSGSLTTPACYESVIWTVLKATSYVSKSQLDSFRSLQQDAHGHDIHYLDQNWRPTQPLNGRTVFRSFSLGWTVQGGIPVNNDNPYPNAAGRVFSNRLISSIGTVLLALSGAIYRLC